MTGRVDVAVVGRAREAELLAAGAATVLAAGEDARAAVVVRAGAGSSRRLAPPTRRAARLRGRLLARELEAVASGRIVWCRGASAHDLARACVGGPVVLAVCSPREPWIEPLLDQAGVVLVAGAADDPVVELALEELRGRSIAAASVPPPDGATSLLARSGLWPDPSLRELLERQAVLA